MLEVKYKVMEDKRVVLCILKTDYAFRFVGKAKCLPTDKFNEERGKKIAYLRALLKLKKKDLQYMDKEYNWYYDRFVKPMIAKVGKMSTNMYLLQNKIDDIQKELNELVKL